MGYEDDKKRDTLTLESTWWIMDREPGMDDLYTKAGGRLDKMTTDLKVEPFRDRNRDKRLFLARFEFPKFGEALQFSGDVLGDESAVAGEVAGFVDFLAGFPADCCEMLLAIGEWSSKPDKVTIVQVESDQPCSPVSKKFFKWPDSDKILLNLTALAVKDRSKILANNLEGEPKPSKLHWWFRVIMRFVALDSAGDLTIVKNKYPVPGEFLALGIRMMPNKPWGKQKSTPFLYSGNWTDTVYYTSAVVTEVIPPNGDITYPTYKVRWRVIGGQGEGVLTVMPSDFAEYKVGDRVTILKDVTTIKKTQLWKDDDMEFFGGQKDMDPADIVWQIAPITFYGLDKEATP